MVSKVIKYTSVSIGLALGLTLHTPSWDASPIAQAAAAQQHHQISPDIPLHSYVYDYIDKLDGLGYLDDMQTGTKPYSRLQVARWLNQMAASAQSRILPTYAKAMLDKLESDFRQELSFLKGSELQHSFSVKEASFKSTYYDGDSLSHDHPRVRDYQPLNINNNGQKYAQDFNHEVSLRLEGYINDRLVVSATPRLSYDDDKHSDTELVEGYVKSNINNLEIQFGKQAVWWGPGDRGGLLLTNNSEPQTSLKLSNVDPIPTGGIFKFLGPANLTVLYAEMEKNRDVSSPSFFASRADFTPSKNFTFGWAMASIVGGAGKSLSGSDYLDFIVGKNAGTAAEDKWNSIAGFDFRWRLPHRGLQLYGELYGEDQAMAVIIPTPSKVAYTAGVYIPRLSADGSWDARMEYATTSNVWYIHSAYTDGYTYKGDIIGDAMGRDADRYYAKVTHYNNNGSSHSLNLETVNPASINNYPQKIESAWLSSKFTIDTNTSLNTAFGASRLSYSGRNSDRNYIASISFIRQY